MTYDIKSHETENVGSLQVAFIEIDVTSYNGTGTTGEDVSGDALELASDPVSLSAQADGKNIGTRWDQSNDRLKLFYPTTSHTHTENTEASYTQNATTESTGGDSTDGPGDELSDTDAGGRVHLTVFYRGL